MSCKLVEVLLAALQEYLFKIHGLHWKFHFSPDAAYLGFLMNEHN
jgi:hypothetical protein